MKIFFDTEFTGLQKETDLISVGIVTEDGKQFFYAEIEDYNKKLVDDWLQSNVIDNLILPDFIKEQTDSGELVQKEPFTWEAEDGKEYTLVKAKKSAVSKILNTWLSQFSEVEVWSDCLAFDWVLFTDLINGSALNLPENIYYIPFDICTLMKVKDVDPDINREEFADIDLNDYPYLKKHNSLFDAIVIRECFNKLQGDSE